MQETKETPVGSLGWEDPLEKEMAIYSSILAWKIPWTEKPGFIYIYTYIWCFPGFPGGSDGKASACNVGDPGSISGCPRDPLEKEMATHSSTLAWKIPWTEEPGRLQSYGVAKNRT